MTIDILAVGAHPDDAEIWCGGLLLKLKDRGYRTGIVHLTVGEMGYAQAFIAPGPLTIDDPFLLVVPQVRTLQDPSEELTSDRLTDERS